MNRTNRSSDLEGSQNENEYDERRLRELIDRILWEKVDADARQRINRVRLVYPKRAFELEMRVLELLQKNPSLTFTDEQIKELLEDLTKKKHE